MAHSFFACLACTFLHCRVCSSIFTLLMHCRVFLTWQLRCGFADQLGWTTQRNTMNTSQRRFDAQSLHHGSSQTWIQIRTVPSISAKNGELRKPTWRIMLAKKMLLFQFKYLKWEHQQIWKHETNFSLFTRSYFVLGNPIQIRNWFQAPWHKTLARSTGVQDSQTDWPGLTSAKMSIIFIFILRWLADPNQAFDGAWEIERCRVAFVTSKFHRYVLLCTWQKPHED